MLASMGPSPPARPSPLARLFRLDELGSDVPREVFAGLTTFAAMAYILVVNPGILAAAGMATAGLITVTALAAASGTLLMAALTNYPLALAPGMGLNAFFALTVCAGMGIPWQAALGMVFWNGVFFLGLSLSGLRGRLAEAIPEPLKIGVQAGIGLFIGFIGLRGAGVVVASPATLVTLGDLGEPALLLTLAGVIVAGALVALGVRAGILAAILGVTIVGAWVPLGDGTVTALPPSIVGAPAGIGETLFALDLGYTWRHPATALPVVFALLFVDLFDTIGTLVGVSRQAGLVDRDGRLPKLGRALTADAAATVIGACLGTSTTTSYIESAAGVEAGGRSGLVGVVVAACFVAALIFAPLLAAIPAHATAAALVLVGAAMLRGLRGLDFDDRPGVLAAFVTLLAMPLAFSISEGIALGFLVYAGVMVLVGRGRELGALTWVMVALCLAHYVGPALARALGG
jgi:AGZA family xanthine/uracil permease-like MFS transporter